jgi:hypothetical protein
MDIGTPDDLDGEAVEVRDGSLQLLPGIAAIGEEPGERGIGIPAAFDEFRLAIAVLDVGRMDQGVEQVVGRFGRDMALAPFGLLAGILAAWSARLGGLHRLAVDDACSRFGLAALCDPHSGHQHRVDRVEQATVIHPVEMVLHRRERGPVRRWSKTYALMTAI